MKRVLLLAPLAFCACAPLINDVTTTPDDPPRFRRLAAYPPANAAVQKAAYPDLAPARRAEPPAAAYAAASAAARRMPRWEVVHEDPAAAVLEAVATTGLLRFKDDVVVRVTPAAGGADVHVRSRSRVGRGDFGANAARIRAYAAELSRERVTKAP